MNGKVASHHSPHRLAVLFVVLASLVASLLVAAPANAESQPIEPYEEPFAAAVDSAIVMVNEYLLGARATPSCEASRMHVADDGSSLFVTGAPVGSLSSPALWHCVSFAEGAGVVSFLNNRALMQRMWSEGAVSSISADAGLGTELIENLDRLQSVLSGRSLETEALVPPGSEFSVVVSPSSSGVVHMQGTLHASLGFYVFGILDIAGGSSADMAALLGPGSGVGEAIAGIDCLAAVEGSSSDAIDCAAFTAEKLSKAITDGRVKVSDDIARRLAPKLDEMASGLGKLLVYIRVGTAVFAQLDLLRSNFEDGAVSVANLRRGDVLRSTSGTAYVADAGVLTPIPDARTYACALERGASAVTVSDRALADILKTEAVVAANSFTCADVSQLSGKLVATTGGARFYVDRTGYRHAVTSDAVAACHGGAANTVSGIHVDDLARYRQTEDAVCAPFAAGDVIYTADGDSYRVVGQPYGLALAPIANGGVFECIVANGARTQLVARYMVAEHPVRVATVTECVRLSESVGVILAEGSTQMLVTAGGLAHVADGVTSRCLTAWRGVAVRPVAAGTFASMPRAASVATCSTGVASGDVLRVAATGASFVADMSGGGAGVLRPIAESETYRCLLGRGATLRDGLSAEQVEAFAVVGAAAPCVNAVAFAGRIIQGPSGRTELINADGAGSHITSGGVFRCLTTWAGRSVVDEVWSQAQLDAVADAAPASCDAHMVARGKIVREPGGHAVFVDAAGTAHNIASGHAFSCLVDSGVAVVEVASHEWQQAFAFGADQPGCQRVVTATDTNVSYFQDADGVLHWIRNTSSYFCATDSGLEVRRTSTQAHLDSLPEGAWFKDCLSPSRYANTMIRQADGTVFVVDSAGRKRHVPDGHSYHCYAAKGYRLAANNLSAEQTSSVVSSSRMPFCLNPAGANGQIIRRSSDGAAWYVSGSCRQHIRDGWTYEFLRERNVAVIDGLNTEHIVSVPSCGSYPYRLPSWRFRNTLVREATGTVWFVDSSGVRRHVRDWNTVERLEEIGHRFSIWSANAEQAASFSYGGSQGLMLAKWKVRGKVVRAHDGTAYWVSSSDTWYWIPNGSIYNHLVRRYGFAGSYTWEHLNSIRRENGRWAGYW